MKEKQESRKNKTLSKGQKKRIVQWEIPHLICALEKKYQISTMHLITPSAFSVYKMGWLVFNGKTGFPIFIGENYFGILICFHVLSEFKARQIRMFIDCYFQKMFLKNQLMSNRENMSFSFEASSSDNPDAAFSERKNTPPPPYEEEKTVLGKKLLAGEQFVDSSSPSSSFFHRKKKKRGLLEVTPGFFPLLLKGKNGEDLLKTAHEFYLKTSSFAFLNTEDFIWKEGVLQEMKEVFVFVPSFHCLSSFQKRVLIQGLLEQKLNCYLVVGLKEKENLPNKWQALFSCVL